MGLTLRAFTHSFMTSVSRRRDGLVMVSAWRVLCVWGGGRRTPEGPKSACWTL